jgi:hypothetical protein
MIINTHFVMLDQCQYNKRDTQTLMFIILTQISKRRLSRLLWKLHHEAEGLSINP